MRGEGMVSSPQTAEMIFYKDIGAIRHFLVVGIGFALIVGWILTLIANTILGVVLQRILGAPPTQFYLGSLFLTVVSISLIALAEIVGNRLFRHKLMPNQFGFASLVFSTLLFGGIVVVFVVPQLGDVIRHYANNTRYFYHHGSELLMMLSLPVGRLILLPLFYFLIARLILLQKNDLP
jgi:hypothetical protein